MQNIQQVPGSEMVKEDAHETLYKTIDITRRM